MPRSSRSKSHNHSSRENSDIDDDVKMKDGNKNGVSGEKRKILVSHEFPLPTKRRREMIHGGSDEGEVVNIDDDDSPKLKRKSSSKFDGDKESGRKEYKNNEWPIKEEMRNIELEKELAKRMKRREGYSDRDIKHKDKVYKYGEKDSKHKDETDRKRVDKDSRDYKHKEERYRNDVERDHRHKTSRAREDTDRKKRSRDHTSEFESKKLKDGSHRHTNSHGESPIHDDRVSKHKDNKDVRRDDNQNKVESSDHRSRSIHDPHLESKRYRNDYPSRYHHRVSKQEETKYRDTVHEERARHNISFNGDLSDKVCIDDVSAEKRLKSDFQLSLSSTNKISSHPQPQPPFEAGGSSEYERGDLNNPKWNSFNPNFGRTQTNWNNVPNWPYTPFHHVPPPMFNPFMYQSLPPMLGVPPMNMNHVTMPYHFPGDGFGNWDHSRTEVNHQSLEPNVVSVDLQSSAQKHEDSVHELTDEISSGQTGPHIENEENNLDFNTPEVMKVTKSFDISMVEKDDDTLISRVYLSKIDVSKDLTRPELYDQCKRMLLDLDQASSVSDDCDCKILFLQEGVEDDIRNSPSLFAAVDDSVFKKAMSLYTKQKVHFTAMDMRSVENQEKENIDVDHPIENQEKENIDVDHPVKNHKTENVEVGHAFENQETENIEVDHLVETQEKENIDVDNPVKNQETENLEVDHPDENQETENIEADHRVENQETENIEEDHPVKNQEKENIEVDRPVETQETESIDVDHPVKNQETENIEVDHPNIDVDHLVKNQETENIEVDHPVETQEKGSINVDHLVKNQETENIEMHHPVEPQEIENIEVDHPFENQETENIEVDHSVETQEKENIKVDYPFENQETANTEVHSVETQENENTEVDHSFENQETENIEVNLVETQEKENIEVDHPVEAQEKENINVDQRVKNQETENTEVDHAVENQETECCAPSVGECEVKVKVNYDGSKEVDNPTDGGSLLVLTNLSTSDVIEFGSVNLSWIHSPE